MRNHYLQLRESGYASRCGACVGDLGSHDDVPHSDEFGRGLNEHFVVHQ
jgi:hypothetical protein